MKLIRGFFLIFLIVIIFSGCSKKSENFQEIPENIIVTEEKEDTSYFDKKEMTESLKKFFYFEDKKAKIFLGKNNLSYIEKIIYKEDIENSGVRVIVEGFPKDMNKGELYFLEYEVYDDVIFSVIGDLKSTILKKPTFVEDSWENNFFDKEYGEFLGEAIVKVLSENTITVEIKPISPIKDGMPEDFRMEYSFEKNLGITEIFDGDEKRLFYDTEESDLLKNISEINLEEIENYQKSVLIISNEKKWINKNQFSLSPYNMKEEYDRFIDSLDVDSYEKIALSLKVFLIFSQSLKENDVLIESLLDLYDEEIYDKKIYNIFDSTYLYSEIFNKGSIRIKELVNIMKWRHENYENILNNPAAIKKDDLKDYIKSLNSLAKRYEKDKFIMKKIELYRDEIPSL